MAQTKREVLKKKVGTGAAADIMAVTEDSTRNRDSAIRSGSLIISRDTGRSVVKADR